MNTLMPYPDFKASVEALDDDLLSQQRVDCLYILRRISEPGHRYDDTAPAKMWQGYDQALVEYALAACYEWQHRGNYCDVWRHIQVFSTNDPWFVEPWWMGWMDFHLSHQSNLVAMYPERYFDKFAVLPGLDYIWPTERPKPDLSLITT